MKKPVLALSAALALSACTLDRTLDTLVPANAYGVVLVEQPLLTSQLLGQTAELPWADLDGGKPWAAAALPGTPPVVFVALALADKPAAWSNVEAWARGKAGLAAARSGPYAVLTSAPLPTGPSFDLARVRTGDLVSVYVDVRNVMAASDQFPILKAAGPMASSIEENLAGLRLGFRGKDGGISITLATDLRPDAPAKSVLRALPRPSGLGKWTGLFSSGDGIRAAAVVPPEAIKAAGGLLNDAGWTTRWAALAPLLGPGLAFSANPRSEGLSWVAAVETSDPQAVRQALKTMVAGGDLQKHFASWSLDADTPLIYQDKPDGAGIRTQVTLGSETVQLAWGDDRVAIAGGPGAAEALVAWKRPAPGTVPWFAQVPSGAAVTAEGQADGLGARLALRQLADGNIELTVWTDAAGLKAWESRVPQVLQGWLAGGAGSKP